MEESVVPGVIDDQKTPVEEDQNVHVMEVQGVTGEYRPPLSQAMLRHQKDCLPIVPATALPPGWTANKSKSHPGYTYYYCLSTGEKTWDRDQVEIIHNKAVHDEQFDSKVIELNKVEVTSGGNRNEADEIQTVGQDVDNLRKLLQETRKDLAELQKSKLNVSSSSNPRRRIGESSFIDQPKMAAGLPKSKFGSSSKPRRRIGESSFSNLPTLGQIRGLKQSSEEVKERPKIEFNLSPDRGNKCWDQGVSDVCYKMSVKSKGGKRSLDALSSSPSKKRVKEDVDISARVKEELRKDNRRGKSSDFSNKIIKSEKDHHNVSNRSKKEDRHRKSKEYINVEEPELEEKVTVEHEPELAKLGISFDEMVDKVNTSSEPELYGMDEEDLEQLRRMKIKYGNSSPKPIIAKSIPAPVTGSIQTQDDRRSDMGRKKIETSNHNTTKETTVSDSSCNTSTESNTPVQLPMHKAHPELVGAHYVNYQDRPKPTYQLKYKKKPRKDKSKFKSTAEEFDRPCRNHLGGEEEVGGDRTPEQATTPEVSLSDSSEMESGEDWLSDNRLNMSQCPDETGLDTSCDGDHVVIQHEELDLSFGVEGGRPPSPDSLELVDQMQEEEMMEWEEVDMEMLMKETKRVRQIISDDDGKLVDMELGMVDDEIVGRLVVVDTNIFISGLELLSQIRDMVGVSLLVPWQVVLELDGLKSSTSKDTAVRTRAAVRWLQSSLVSKSGVKAQTQAQSRALKVDSGCSADDRILASCLSLDKEVEFLYLLTDDINLANKAVINSIKVGGSDSILKLLAGGCPEVQPKDVGGQNKWEEVLIRAKLVIRDLLELVLRKEFLLAYGEKLWLKIVSIKPKPERPYWSLDNLFKLFNKHHIAVFGMVFPRNGHELRLKLDGVKEKLSSSKGDVRQIVKELAGLVGVIRERDVYDGMVDISEEKLTELINQVVDVTDEKIKIVNTVDNSEKEIVMVVFNNVWEVIAAFSRAYANLFGVAHTLPDNFQPDIVFNCREEAGQSLPGFFSQVSQLHEEMSGLMKMNRGHLTNFYNLLVGFRSSLSLDQSYWPVLDIGSMSREMVDRFVSSLTNMALMEGGLKQIADFRQVLVTCIGEEDNQEDDLM